MIRSLHMIRKSKPCVGTLYVDATRFDSSRLGSAQARRHDIPRSCVPKFDTRSTRAANLFKYHKLTHLGKKLQLGRSPLVVTIHVDETKECFVDYVCVSSAMGVSP
ncbi:hypothetical protein Hanom_Chr07g00604421 [Helianthus anomalus]